MPYTIAELNGMSQPEFVDAVGAVFEDTPAIAAQAWNHRPFEDVSDLYQKLISTMHQLNEAEQLTFICAHPDLGSKTKMADSSVQEQSGLGLDRLSPEEYAQFNQLNQAYRTKFGFPFIVAVKNHTKASILAAFEQRLNNSKETEQQQALNEIAQIVQFRVLSLVQ